MSGRRSESLIVDDILSAVERLIELGATGPLPPLGSDDTRSEAVLYNLIVLGEATKRLIPVTRDRFTDVPWRELARVRDRIVHHYEGIDWHVVGHIVSVDLPAILPRMREVQAIVRDTEPG